MHGLYQTYYYEVQSQLFVCCVEYGDFCVCTFLLNEDESHHLETGMHIEWMYKDPDVWTECTTKSSQFSSHVYYQRLWETSTLGQISILKSATQI